MKSGDITHACLTPLLILVFTTLSIHPHTCNLHLLPIKNLHELEISNLCITEKLAILLSKKLEKNNSLNSRSEVAGKLRRPLNFPGSSKQVSACQQAKEYKKKKKKKKKTTTTTTSIPYAWWSLMVKNRVAYPWRSCISLMCNITALQYYRIEHSPDR